MSDTTPTVIDAEVLEATLAPEDPPAKVVPNPAPAKKAPAKPAAKKAPAKKAPATKDVAKVDKPIEGEVVEKPLSATAAKALDKKVRAAAGAVSDTLTDLSALLAEAAKGQIHLALGMRSWTEYMGTIKIPVLGKEATTEAIEMLHEAGMPQRAIAESTGVPLTTVHRKVKEAEAKAEESGAPKAPATSVGKDGKEYRRKTEGRKAGAAKASATKTKAKGDTGRASGKPPSQQQIILGDKLNLLGRTNAHSFKDEGQIKILHLIKEKLDKLIIDIDNNHTAKA